MVKRKVRMIKSDIGEDAIVLPKEWIGNLTVDEVLDREIVVKSRFVDGRMELISGTRGKSGQPAKVKPSEIMLFLKECCKLKSGEWTPTEELYAKYLKYAEVHETDPNQIWSDISFAKRLSRINGIYPNRRTIKSVGKQSGWMNVALKVI